jgi:hypothetical protein
VRRHPERPTAAVTARKRVRERRDDERGFFTAVNLL